MTEQVYETYVCCNTDTGWKEQKGVKIFFWEGGGNTLLASLSASLLA